MAGLSIGEKAPAFELPDQQDYPWSLSGQLEIGPVVLVFYRGDWSPYCNGQLACYARRFEEFEQRGVQAAGISVDPPRDNAKMVGKLLLPFPLLSDPVGEIARLYGAWNADEGVATPSVFIVDQEATIRYAYSGSDFADRPVDEDVFGAMKHLDARIERRTGEPETRVTAVEARETSVRPDRDAIDLEQIVPYFQGVLVATGALGGRFGGWGRSGRKASEEVSGFRGLVREYARAVDETIQIKREEA